MTGQRALFGSSPQNRNVSYQEQRKYQSFAAVGKSPEAILSVMLEDWRSPAMSEILLKGMPFDAYLETYKIYEETM